MKLYNAYSTVGAAFLAAALSATAAAQAGYYVAVDLGTLGGQGSFAEAVNSDGLVVGDADDSENVIRAYVHSGGAMTDLGTLGGDVASAQDINDLGQIAGYSANEEDEHRAFLYLLYSGGTMIDLGTLGGYSRAYGLNSDGDVVGASRNTEVSQTRAFLYSGGAMTDLGTLGGSYSTAEAINDRGHIAGSSRNSDNDTRAFLYKNGTMDDLGTFGGTTSAAYDINNDGQVVGYAKTSDGDEHAFMFTDDIMFDLNDFCGCTDESRAYGANDDGLAVGRSRTDQGDLYAFYFDGFSGGSMIDLNTLINPDLGWDLYQANDINNSGQIVGNADIGDETHGFLLTEALPGDADLDGTVDLADLTQLLTFYNQSVSEDVSGWMKGDFDGDGDVKLADLTDLLTFYNQGVLDAAAAELLAAHGVVVETPEPGTLALAVAGLIGLICHAWRKRL